MRRVSDSYARATSGTFAALVTTNAVSAHHIHRVAHTDRVRERPTMVELAAQQPCSPPAAAAARAI
jgi:hypothetical protein